MPKQSLQGSTVVRLFLALWLAITPTFVWAGSMTLLGVGGPAAGGGPTTTWNPADKAAAFTLSNGNLTATNSGGGFSSLRAIASHSTGKFYHEIHIDAFTSTGNAVFGVANSSATLASFCGADANAVGVQLSTGNVLINSSVVSTIQTTAVGNTLGIATDFGNSKIWYRTNGGNWNNDVIGNQNPATNTGGVSISTLGAGPYFPCGTASANTDAFTANFGATAYANSAPAGFGNW